MIRLISLALWAISVILTESAMTALHVSESTDFSQPVSPAIYQAAIGQGFATNYFKDVDELGVAAKKYRPQNIDDVYNNGFRNLRLRCLADKYKPPYNKKAFNRFLNKLEEVVDKCLEVGVAPIISWIHHKAEALATEEDRDNYILWWKKVAKKLRNKSYRLSFNLFTELGVDYCANPENNVPRSCDGSLRKNTDKYNDWTARVVRAIRNTGGNNVQRILILSSPQKTAFGLKDISDDIYKKDDYMMVEWHEYAAGPYKKLDDEGNPRPRYWSGSGTNEERKTLKKGLEEAASFTEQSGLPSYFGAWMPRDNYDGGLHECEVINFANYFVSELKLRGIPWSLNVLDNYYDTENSEWITKPQDFGFPCQATAKLNMSHVLESIKAVM